MRVDLWLGLLLAVVQLTALEATFTSITNVGDRVYLTTPLADGALVVDGVDVSTPLGYVDALLQEINRLESLASSNQVCHSIAAQSPLLHIRT
jgi:hypothetical protein